MLPVALLLVLSVAIVPTSAQTPSESGDSVSFGRRAVPGPPPLDATALGANAPVSVILIEASTGQLLAVRDADVRRPIASAIKLVTALAVVEALPPGTIIVVGEEVRGAEGSSYGLRPGDVRSVEDLLVGLLLRSGNEVSLALAVAIDGSQEAFVSRMSAVLASLGIEARPATASGLDPADALSAAELAVVARAALAEPRIRDLIGTPVLSLAGAESVENRNLFLGDVSGATGLKTGFTTAAGYTLAASAMRDGRELVAVVLGAADDRTRRDIAARLIEHGFAATVPTTVRRSVTLRTASGPVRFATADTVMTLARNSETVALWPSSLRPDDDIAGVEVRIDRSDAAAVSAGTVGVERLDGRRAPEGPSLGRALADGVYAALRPNGLVETLR